MNALRSVLPYYRPYWKGMVIGLGMVVLAQAFSLANPYIVKIGFDSLEDPGTTPGRLVGLALLIVAAALLGGAARYAMRELLNGISRRMEVDLRNDFFRHLMRLDPAFYGARRTGDLMSRATNDTLAVRQAAGPAVMYTVNTAVGFVLAVALMFWISPRLTLLAMVPMVILPPIVIWFGKVIHRRFDRIQAHFSTLSTFVQENLTGVRIVRAYGQEAAQAEQFAALNEEYRERNMDLVKAAGLFHPLLGLIVGVAMVGVLWFGGREVIAGRMTPGDYVAFFFYLGFLAWPMIALGWVVNLFQRGAASMARMNEILEHEPSLPLPAQPVSTAEAQGEVVFRNVSFRYPGTERLVLDGVSFTAHPGETVALVGPTGSGKSTIVSLIPRLYDPSEGQVLLDGHPLTDYDLGALRRVIGMVPQDPFLFSESIGENIALGLDPAGPEPVAPGAEAAGARRPVAGGATGASGATGAGGATGASGATGAGDGAVSGDAAPRPSGSDPEPTFLRSAPPAVAEAARIAQLHESVEGFPRGYGTLLGERGINLSGGQKQRATLARAVARDPKVLVLDDALSAVDTHTESKILHDLRRVMAGRTSFIISHRVSAVMDADQILVLEDGRIVERGTHAELLALEGTYARLLRRQLLEEEVGSVPAGAAGD